MGAVLAVVDVVAIVGDLIAGAVEAGEAAEAVATVTEAAEVAGIDTSELMAAQEELESMEAEFAETGDSNLEFKIKQKQKEIGQMARDKMGPNADQALKEASNMQKMKDDPEILAQNEAKLKEMLGGTRRGELNQLAEEKATLQSQEQTPATIKRLKEIEMREKNIQEVGASGRFTAEGAVEEQLLSIDESWDFSDAEQGVERKLRFRDINEPSAGGLSSAEELDMYSSFDTRSLEEMIENVKLSGDEESYSEVLTDEYSEEFDKAKIQAEEILKAAKANGLYTDETVDVLSKIKDIKPFLKALKENAGKAFAVLKTKLPSAQTVIAGSALAGAGALIFDKLKEAIPDADPGDVEQIQEVIRKGDTSAAQKMLDSINRAKAATKRMTDRGINVTQTANPVINVMPTIKEVASKGIDFLLKQQEKLLPEGADLTKMGGEVLDMVKAAGEFFGNKTIMEATNVIDGLKGYNKEKSLIGNLTANLKGLLGKRKDINSLIEKVTGEANALPVGNSSRSALESKKSSLKKEKNQLLSKIKAQEKMLQKVTKDLENEISMSEKEKMMGMKKDKSRETKCDAVNVKKGKKKVAVNVNLLCCDQDSK